MNTTRACGCKGVRTCLICEKEHGLQTSDHLSIRDKQKGYVYCPFCNKAWQGWDMKLYKQHPDHEGASVDFPGVYIQCDFLSANEEINLANDLDQMPWTPSQSGRRKQNFGPKTNFKRKKIAEGSFNGFPLSTKFVQDRFKSVKILEGYDVIEQCSLEYDPLKGASIDPHIDDCWIWGERVVTVNLLADSVLTMTRYKGDTSKYNLDCAKNYSHVVNSDGTFNTEYQRMDVSALEVSKPLMENDVVVRIPMMRRSLLVLYGEARYHWEHTVFREDVKSRRVCLAFREFTPPYMPKGSLSIGHDIREKAKNFFNVSFAFA